MKYLFIVLICLPKALMAQSVNVSQDTVIKNHYLVKNGSKYLFTHEQWVKMKDYERVKFITIGDIQEALKRRGYYQGKINNKMNNLTKKALTQWRMDKGLPAHGDFDMFKSLGLFD